MFVPNAFYLSLLVLSATTTASTAVLPIAGAHKSDVAISSVQLTDTARLDPFAHDGSLRKLMVSIFHPVPECHRTHLISYMPPATAEFQNDKFAAYGLPNGSFNALQLEACNSTATPHCLSSKSVPLPVVLFSGALSTSRLVYSSMLQSIAAAGYVVVSVDHPYDTDIVEFPDGTIFTGLDIETDADIELALSTRVGDIAFVHQQLLNSSFVETALPSLDSSHGKTAPKTAILGHSLGGAAAASVMLALPKISGGVNLDGSMFGSVLELGFDRPFMLMGHENKTQQTDPSWKQIWLQLTGWKREFEVKKATHYSFSDLPLVTEVLRLNSKLPEEIGLVLGTIEGSRMRNLTVSYVTSFLDLVLKGNLGGVLKNGNQTFPEVKRVEW
jgi:pimeloyl-ACP methyl ester carboxylesterase